MIPDLLRFAGQLALDGLELRLRAAAPPAPRPGVIETRQRADGVFEAVLG